MCLRLPINWGQYAKYKWDISRAEVFYRTEYNNLANMTLDKQIIFSTKGKETMIADVEWYIMKLYGIPLKILVKQGTKAKLEDMGVKDYSNATMDLYPNMPFIYKGWKPNNAYFKGEKAGTDLINIGLGKGKALKTLNKNVIKIELIKPNE